MLMHVINKTVFLLHGGFYLFMLESIYLKYLNLYNPDQNSSLTYKIVWLWVC